MKKVTKVEQAKRKKVTQKRADYTKARAIAKKKIVTAKLAKAAKAAKE
jgi:hypothetical protein